MDDRRHRSAFGQGSENDYQELVSARARRRQMLAVHTARRDAIADRRISGRLPAHPSLTARWASYRQRWTIETLFANLKTKGFNLEDTHITDPDKLSTLLAVLALTVTLCVKTGVARAAPSYPHQKNMAAGRGRSLLSASVSSAKSQHPRSPVK